MVRKEDKKGITLIALVITVIVLIILASITIGTLEKDGILSKTKETEKDVEISEEKDLLSIAVVGAIKNSSFGEVEEETLNKELKENIGEGKYILDATTIKDKFVVTFTDSEREYLIDKEGNIEEYRGVVVIEVVEKTTNNIKINVTAISKEGMPENPEYKYYIKKSSESSYPDEANYIGPNTNHNFTGLEEDTSYTIKVVTTDKAGNVIEEEQTEKTMKILVGNITFGTPVWSEGKARVKISTDSDFLIKYQINSTTGTWITIINGGEVNNLRNGDTVYARLQYGTDYGDYKEITIQDLIGPTVNVTTSSSTTKSITATVSAVDNESGMPASPTYSYYIKKSSVNSYPSEATYTGTEPSYKFDELDQTTSYDIKVTTVDNSGNTGTGTALNNTTGIVPSGKENGTIVFGTPQWSGGKASVTISTTKTNYTIEYQVNGIDGTWTPIENLGTVSSLSNGDTVYARLTDGKNAGDYASVTILDGIDPIISSFIVTGYDAATISVKTSAVDNESGIESYTYEYKKETETAYTNAQTTTSSTYTYANLEDGTTYNLRVTVLDKAGNDATSMATQKTVTLNKAPVLDSVALDSKTTSSITIAAKATDTDGDNLTYMLYTGTSSSNLSLAKTSSSTAQGIQTTLSQSSLSAYTDYYYRIDVTDGESTTTGSVNSVRTYCPGTGLTCAGPFSKQVTCTTCKGIGKIDEDCTFEQTGGGGAPLVQECPTCGPTLWMYSENTCTECNNSYTGYICARCQGEITEEEVTKTHQVKCSTCKGNKTVSQAIKCEHEKSSQHSYCSHDRTEQHDD